MKKTNLILTALIAATLSGTSVANDVTEKMKTKFPGSPVTSAKELADFPGVVELVMGKNQVMYTNTEGTRLMIGHIFDPRTNTDLTQQRIESLSFVDFKTLPLKDAITIKKGKGEREIAVFSDPDCPYCKKLEEELKLIDNITVHVFPFPLAMHPEAKTVSEGIVCSKDKAKAWTDYMLNGVKPQMTKKCDAASSIDRNIELGSKIGVNGTPAMIAFNGRIKPGFAPAAQLELWLNENAMKPQAKAQVNQEVKK